MINLFDVVRAAQGGSGPDALARQFGIDGDLARRAVDALLPAFSVALRRNALDPNAFGDLVGLLGSGRYAPFFDNPGFGMSPDGAASARDLLGRLFGPDDGSRRVAEQVSSATGLGLQVVQQIMPTLAGMIAGGLFRSATVNGYADLLRQWSDVLKRAAPDSRPPPQASDPWSAWTEMAAAMTRPKSPEPRPDLNPLKPWSDMMGAMLGAPPKPEPPPPPRPANPFEALAQMFDAGREVQAQHLANVQAVLDAAWGGKR